MNVQYIVSSHPKYTHYRKVTEARRNKENILITSSLVSALLYLHTSSQLQLYQHLLKPLLLIEGRPHNLAQCASLCQAGCGCEAGLELQTINRRCFHNHGEDPYYIDVNPMMSRCEVGTPTQLT